MKAEIHDLSATIQARTDGDAYVFRSKLKELMVTHNVYFVQAWWLPNFVHDSTNASAAGRG